MSYQDFDEKIENEIISLSHLTKNKSIDEFSSSSSIFLTLQENEKEKSEQLNNESLKLYYRIDERKNKELESTFKTPKLNLKSPNLRKLGKGKFIGIVKREFIIYESKYFNKLFNIKIEKNFDESLSVIELDNNDIIFLARKKTSYNLLIYRLKDNKYSLLQKLEENSKGYEPQRSYSGCRSFPKSYKMKFLEKLSRNKFISISNYGFKIYSLNENNQYSLVLMDEYLDGDLKLYEINENQLIFCVKEYIRASLVGGPSHDYIQIEEVGISNIIKNEKEKLQNLGEIIPSLKLKSTYKCLFEYSTRRGLHELSDSITLNNKYFLVFVDNHLLIFNLINFELMKRYSFIENGVDKFCGIKYCIQKWKNSSDNEFLIITGDNITLLKLSEKNFDGKITLDLKVIGYTYLPFSDYSSFEKLDEENRFYIKKKEEILFY